MVGCLGKASWLGGHNCCLLVVVVGSVYLFVQLLAGAVRLTPTHPTLLPLT